MLSRMFGLRLTTVICSGLLTIYAGASAMAFDENGKRTPRLGQILNDQPHRSGLMYLAPTRAPDQVPAEEIEIRKRVDRKNPWTTRWINDCAARHKGFDPQTGTYLSESGQYKFCD